MAFPLQDLESLVAGLRNIDSPVLPAGWFAIAFNRNLYEDLAPRQVWDALFACVSENLGGECWCYFGEESKVSNGEISSLDRVSLKREILLPALYADFRYLKDLVVVSPNLDWLVRLDQDVSSFAFRLEFSECIFGRLGGIEAVENRMLCDFDGTKGGASPVERFVSMLLSQAMTGSGLSS